MKRDHENARDMTQNQLSLFADLDAVDPAAIDDGIRDLAARLSPRIHLGTSTWSFPGWTGPQVPRIAIGDKTQYNCVLS
jgi:hypothetical protein